MLGFGRTMFLAHTGFYTTARRTAPEPARVDPLENFLQVAMPGGKKRVSGVSRYLLANLILKNGSSFLVWFFGKYAFRGASGIYMCSSQGPQVPSPPHLLLVLRPSSAGAD